MNNFDRVLLSNALIDLVISSQFESLETDHMQVLAVCCSDPQEFQDSHLAESWFKVFQKAKDYLLVTLCDPDLCDQGLIILHNFLTADSLRYQVYDDAREIFSKSLELLFSGESDICKQKFKEYLQSKVILKGAQSGDNSLKKFFKALFIRFKDEQGGIFEQNKLGEVLTELSA